MARPSSAVGPVGVPMCLLVNIFALQCPRSPVGSKTFRKAARRCPACLYPNDVDATFCQACGSRTCLEKFVVPTKTIDHAEIAKRFQEFNNAFKAKPYQRQKSALDQELLDFLASLSLPRDVSSCTSGDIIKFLISKDKSGILSNPVAHARVKQYFKFIREEQAGKAIVPSQAVPLFFC